jgi:beta-1,4-mannosyltransferase
MRATPATGPRSSRRSTGRRSISSLSRAGQNPYLDLLYGHLTEAGVPRGPEAKLRLRWLLAHRRDVRYLHLHWPEHLYRFARGPTSLRPLASCTKLLLLAARLRVARLLGYRLVWTVHQVYPHAGATLLDRVGARLVAHNAYLLVAHDPETATRARAELGAAAARIEVVHHGSYVGVYPPGRPRAEMRRELGIGEGTVAFVCFGELRANSEVATLLEAFSSTAGDSSLVIAGHVKDRGAGAAVAEAAARDDRIVRIEGFVRREGVRELYDAADVAVIPRSDGGTSGSLILALSLGKPVVVADAPGYRRLTSDGQAAWLFRGGDAADLRSALERAAADPADRKERAAAARHAAEVLDWRDAATRLASLLPS